MLADVLLVCQGPVCGRPSRWELLRALRSSSSQAYGLVRDYPWVAGASPLSWLTVVTLAVESETHSDRELTDAFAYTACWDYKGSQEEIYVTLLLLHALTVAVPGLSARLLLRHPNQEDIPILLQRQREPAMVEDALLLEFASAVEEDASLDVFLADCGTDDFSYERDLVGHFWFFPGGRLGVVPVAARRDASPDGEDVFFSVSSHSGVRVSMPEAHWLSFLTAASGASAAPWSRVLNQRVSDWLTHTARPAGSDARHSLAIAVPPVVALTLHALSPREWHTLVLHHCYDYPLAVGTTTATAAAAPLVVPARGSSSKWFTRLEAGEGSASAERECARTESHDVAALWDAFAVQAQSARLVRFPLRGFSRYAFVRLLCASVPEAASSGLPKLAVTASGAPRQPLTVESLQLGFQMTWALARWQKDLDRVSERDRSTQEPARQRLLRAAERARHRVAQCGLPLTADTDGDGSADTLAALECELFSPDTPDRFQSASSAWVAESVAAVQREFLRPSSPTSDAIGGWEAAAAGHTRRVEQALSVTAPDEPTESDGNATGDDDDDDGTVSTSNSSTQSDDYVAAVLQEMEQVRSAIQPTAKTGVSEDTDASTLLGNKPFLDVMELLSQTPSAPK